MTPMRANGKLVRETGSDDPNEGKWKATFTVINYNMNRSLVHPLHWVSFESKKNGKTNCCV